MPIYLKKKIGANFCFYERGKSVNLATYKRAKERILETKEYLQYWIKPYLFLLTKW